MKTILLVEDNQLFQKLISKKILQKGYEVLIVNSVEGALENLANKKVDVVWLDHYLFGKKDGLDLVASMKAVGSKYSKIPVFVVSNSTDHEKTSAYLRMGVNKYYVKSSVSLNEIIEEMSVFLVKDE